MAKEYFAFISYKSEDVAWAVWLQHELEHYHLPALYNGREDIRHNLRPVFRDIDELSAGNLPEQIHDALVNSQNLIVICSPNAAKSPWVNQEVETFISLDRTDRIFPFIIEGNSPKEFFPPALLNLPKSQERLGGEIGKKGRDAAFVKIVAGMLHVDFDSLWNGYEREKANNELIEREKKELPKIKAIDKDFEYFVFISYSSLDNVWAVWLRDELEHYHLPSSFNERTDVRDNLRKVFRDRDELSAGTEWNYQVYKALSETCNLIVICSPNAAQSDAVNEEIEQFIALGREDHIYPFIVEGDKPEQCFPPALNHSKLGGDINKDGGRDAAFVKVVAGMLNQKFSALWQRYEKDKAEEQQRQKEQRDNLLRVQSRFISEKTIDLVENGDSYLAQRILLEVMPKDLENPDRPYTPEAEVAFRKALKNPSAILYGHKERVNCAVYSPDGKTIFSGGEDNRIHIWDAQTGKEIQKYHEHSDGIDDIVFSPDGKRFVSIASSSLIIWDTESKQKLLEYRDIYPRVYAVAFNPNGKTIAIAQQHNIIILDVETGNEQFTITGHTGIIHSISFSPDGEYIISTAMDDDIHIWDATTGMFIKKIVGFVDSNVSFSPDGKYIIADTSILDAQTGEELIKLDGHKESVNSSICSPNGKLIVTASWDRTVRVWDIETGNELKKLEGHTDGVTSASFSPDGKYIVSTSLDKTIRIWQVDSLPGFFSVEKMKMIGTGKRTIFSNDGKKIISISYSDYYDNIIQIWDAKTGFELKRLIGHKRTINSIALSPDGQHIASASSDKSIRIWDIETGELLSLIQGHNDEVYAVAYSPDGKYLASASSDETIRIWDATTGIEIKRIESEEEYIPSIIFSLDGRFIAAAAFMFIKIWNIDTGEEHKRIDTDNLVKHVAYSPDGQYIVAATDNDILRLWNATTGVLVREMVGHAKGINYVAFSPNGEYIVSASEDSTVRIWNVETGIEILKLDQNAGRVFCAAFSPDGTRVVTAPDEEIRIWDFPAIQDLIDQTREQFKDYPLTTEERKKYFLD